jgi:hypothetical protein
MKSTLSCFAIIFCLFIKTIVVAQSLPTEWIQRFRPQGLCTDRLLKVEVDSAGNIYTAGSAGGERGTPDAFIMKRGPLGDTLWTYYYDAGVINEDYIYDFTYDQVGNVYITGASHASTNSFADCFTAKLNVNGVQQWFTRYPSGTFNETQGNAIAIDSIGNIYVAGYFDPQIGSLNWLVVKYNNSGVQQWVDIYNGPLNGEDQANDVVIAPNGNATVCGYYWDSTALGAINTLVRQYSSTGAISWQDTYTNPTYNGFDKAIKLKYTANGELRVAAISNASSSNFEVLGIAYAANGTRLWATIYPDATSNQGEYLYGADVDSLGKIYFAGTDFRGGIITCINADGSLGWRKAWKGPVTPPRDVFFDVIADNNGGVYTTGKGIFPGTDYTTNGGIDNLIIVKYSDTGDSLWTHRIYDTLSVSNSFDITLRVGKVYSVGFKADSADAHQDHFITVLDTAGSYINRWQYNGKGDGVVTGAFVKTDAQNNIYCAATVDRFDSKGNDIVIVKYNPAGVEQWAKYYTSQVWNNDTLVAMQFDPSGDIILCVGSDSANTKTKYITTLVKINTSGQFLDTAFYIPTPRDNTFPKTMLVQNDGSVIVGATSSSMGGLILKFDIGFNIEWVARIDSSTILSSVNTLASFPNGDIAIGGYSRDVSSVSTAKGLIQRFTPSGNKLWSTDVDSVGFYDEVVDLDVNQLGNIAAVTTSSITIVVVGLLGNSGFTSWRQVYNPSTTTEKGVGLHFTPAGNITLIVSGFNGFVYRYTTVQYSGAGVFQWATVYNLTPSDREPTAMMTDASNNIITAGYKVVTNVGNFDYVLVAYNSLGSQIFLNNYATGSTPNPDRLRSFTRDLLGNYIVTGESSFETINNWHYRMLTIKYGNTPVGINEVTPSTLKDNVYAYPNPSFDGKFMLLDGSPHGNIDGAQIFNIQGQLMKSIEVNNDQFDLSTFPAGIYFMNYTRNKMPAGTLKLVKSGD